MSLNSKAVKELYQAILLLENEEECKAFLRDLLTEAEIKEFSNRWKVARLLDQHIPYEKIVKETGMSSTTIARISKWLTGEIGGYQLIINKLENMKIINSISNSHHTSL